MNTNRFLTKYSRLLAGLSLLLLSSQCRQDQGKIHTKLRSYLDSIRVIDTHEHQRNPVAYGAAQHNLFVNLSSSYLNSDIVSAGSEPIDLTAVQNESIDTLWTRYSPYLQFTENTSYYNQLIRGYQRLYEFEDRKFTKDNVISLNKQIEQNYQDYEAWFDRAFVKAGFEMMIVDKYWNPYEPVRKTE